jgi:probable HAF family extracellular repeat protein
MKRIATLFEGASIKIFRTVTVVALCMFTTSVHAQTEFPHYRVVDLGTLGGSYSQANAIIGVGENMRVVGVAQTTIYSSDYGNEYHAFSWTPRGDMQDLGTLPGAEYSQALAANSVGEVVGESDTAGAPNLYGFEWSAATGVMNMNNNDDISCPYIGPFNGINVFGEMTGSVQTPGCAGNSAAHATTAFFGTRSGNVTNLGTLPGDISSVGNGINFNGHVTGYSSGPVTCTPICTASTHAFLWTKTTGMRDLGTLPGGNYSAGNAISYYDAVAGQSNASNGFYYATEWPLNGKPENLGVLPGGHVSSATTFGADHEIFGYSSYSNPSPSTFHAFVWIHGLGMRDLNTLIPSDSGWTLAIVYGCNSQGFAVGYGTINGQGHAFLLVPVQYYAAFEYMMSHPE